MGLRLYQIAVWAYAALYIAALALLAIGTFGLFGQERDPLAGVFLMPLGLPWTLLLDDVPPAEARWVAMTAPLANLLLVAVIRRQFSTS
ncbi:hypothetical protein P2H44_16305 [Albimonas sp. CAU 1670]|uniref:hypothetical protein n=1 Tax=Albimonas sp. CAU 1670 TaxID=3032599 RepID=UPI0023DBA57E|nr:hypothetical protein [Albimonas sp. CAU 1670]MDF2234125.1 hypothetical protein [Albimonas sp. CAU 1670]